jgi:endo-alpha-1,4-polygalactosaminidase (GH114 family)
MDKKTSCIELGYNFLVIDESYFDSCKTDDMIEKIKTLVVDFSKIEKRIK